MSTLILEVNKHLLMYILFQIDFQTHMFGYSNICVWIYLIRRVGPVLYRASKGVYLPQMTPHNWFITSCITDEFENFNLKPLSCAHESQLS